MDLNFVFCKEHSVSPSRLDGLLCVACFFPLQQHKITFLCPLACRQAGRPLAFVLANTISGFASAVCTPMRVTHRTAAKFGLPNQVCLFASLARRKPAFFSTANGRRPLPVFRGQQTLSFSMGNLAACCALIG